MCDASLFQPQNLMLKFEFRVGWCHCWRSLPPLMAPARSRALPRRWSPVCWWTCTVWRGRKVKDWCECHRPWWPPCASTVSPPLSWRTILVCRCGWSWAACSFMEEELLAAWSKGEREKIGRIGFIVTLQISVHYYDLPHAKVTPLYLLPPILPSVPHPIRAQTLFGQKGRVLPVGRISCIDLKGHTEQDEQGEDTGPEYFPLPQGAKLEVLKHAWMGTNLQQQT